MNVLAKFKDKQLDAQSMRQIKGGIYSQIFDCTLENGESFQVYAHNWDAAFAYIDSHNSHENYYAIVGCAVE